MKKATIGFLFLFLFPSKIWASGIVINEFLPNPSSGEDWVELYNTSSDSVDISRWYLRDAGTSTHMGDFPSDTTISAGGFATIDVGTRLDKKSDTITLYNHTDEVINSHAYGSDPGSNISIGRYLDGGDWINLQTPTKNSSNNGGNPVPTSTPTPISPTTTPTPVPTSTLVPSTTPIPTISQAPMIAPTHKITAKSEAIPTMISTQPNIFGESTIEEEPTPTTVSIATNELRPIDSQRNKKSQLFSLILTISGGLLIAAAVPFTVQQVKKRVKKNLPQI